MDINKNVKIKVQLKYNYLMPFFLGLALIVVMFLPLMLFGISQEEETIIIIWFIIFPIFIVFSFMYSGYAYQTAYLSNDSIIIKNVFFTLKKIMLNDIRSIEILNLPTMSSLVKVMYFEWIVIYTSEIKNVKYGGKNRKNNSYLQIINTKENIEKLEEHFNKYSDLKIKSN